MELLDFLRNTPDPFQALEGKYAVKHKRHTKYNNLVLLKYSQLDSPMGKKIVQQCRGVIVDEDNDYNIVCMTYIKFFNHLEGHADKIDFSTSRCYEKLDGSLCQLYFYDHQWHVATSGTPDASGEVMGTSTTFSELFWKVWKECGYSLKYADPKMCYAFELCTKYNRVIVKHDKNRLVLHGVRRLSDLKEQNPIVVAYQNDWECVKTFPLGSFDEIVETAKELDPIEAEGYVVCDMNNYARVKIKSPAYIAVHNLKDGFSTRRILEIVRTNERSEFLSYFPEFIELYYQVKAKYDYFLGKIEGFYEAIKDIDDRKQFALKATTQKFSGVLFNWKFKNKTAKESLSEMPIKHLEEWLQIQLVEL